MFPRQDESMCRISQRQRTEFGTIFHPENGRKSIRARLPDSRTTFSRCVHLLEMPGCDFERLMTDLTFCCIVLPFFQIFRVLHAWRNGLSPLSSALGMTDGAVHYLNEEGGEDINKSDLSSLYRIHQCRAFFRKSDSISRRNRQLQAFFVSREKSICRVSQELKLSDHESDKLGS